ncbi:MAG: hypothetical protein ACLGIR_12140 [Actinomycetes bacterium]
MDTWGRDDEDEQRPDRDGGPGAGRGGRHALDLGAAVEEHVAAPPWARDEPAAVAAGARRPGVVLLALAVLPWLLVGAVVLRGPGAAGTVPAAGADTTTLATPGDGPPPAPADPVPGAGGPTPEDRPDRSGDATPASPDRAGSAAGVDATPRRGIEVLAEPLGGDLLVAAAALGEVVVRARLTTGGPPVDGWAAATGAPRDPGGDVQHVDHVTTESVHVPAVGRIVVVVLAVVLRSDDGTVWTEAQVERHAVALELDPGGSLRTAGAVWPLPPPTPDRAAAPDAATGPEVDDPDLRLAAVAGLEAGGWAVDELTLARPAPDLLVAVVRGTGPDGRRSPGTPVWLVPTPTGLAPAGTPARPGPGSGDPGATTDEPTPSPEERPSEETTP